MTDHDHTEHLLEDGWAIAVAELAKFLLEAELMGFDPEELVEEAREVCQQKKDEFEREYNSKEATHGTAQTADR